MPDAVDHVTPDELACALDYECGASDISDERCGHGPHDSLAARVLDRILSDRNAASFAGPTNPNPTSRP